MRYTTRLGLCALLLLLAGCPLCEDTQGNPTHFTAGPESTDAYSISALQACSKLAAEMGSFRGMFTGAVVITGKGTARPATEDWLRQRVAPALAAERLSLRSVGTGEPCDASKTVLFVKIKVWYDADRAARIIGAKLAAEGVGGEVYLVVELDYVSC